MESVVSILAALLLINFVVRPILSKLLGIPNLDLRDYMYIRGRTVTEIQREMHERREERLMRKRRGD